MTTLEYAQFVEQLISATVELFGVVSYHTYTFSPTKIKIKLYGKDYKEQDFYKFKSWCRDLSIRHRDQFEKFNIGSTPQIYFCSELKTVSIKWFVNINQWLDISGSLEK